MELNVVSSDGKKFKLDLFLVLTFKSFFEFNKSYNLYLSNIVIFLRIVIIISKRLSKCDSSRMFFS